MRRMFVWSRRARPPTMNWRCFTRDLKAATAERRPPRADGRQGLMSLELANAITLSSYIGQPVALPLDRAAYNELLTSLKAGPR